MHLHNIICPISHKSQKNACVCSMYFINLNITSIWRQAGGSCPLTVKEGATTKLINYWWFRIVKVVGSSAFYEADETRIDTILNRIFQFTNFNLIQYWFSLIKYELCFFQRGIFKCVRLLVLKLIRKLNNANIFSMRRYPGHIHLSNF